MMPRLPRKWSAEEDKALREEVLAQLAEGGVKDWCRVASKLQGRTNKDCRKRWHNAVAGGLKKGQWAKSEDHLLRHGVERHGQRWTLVAEEVQTRSADQCAKRWQQSLNPALDRSEWTEQENRRLLQAVAKIGRHWKEIQQLYFPGRSKNCIKNRYTVLTRRIKNHGDDATAYLHNDDEITDGEGGEDDVISEERSEADTECSSYYEHDSGIDSATGDSPACSGNTFSPSDYCQLVPSTFWEDDDSLLSFTNNTTYTTSPHFNECGLPMTYDLTTFPTDLPTPTQQAWWNAQQIPMDAALDPSLVHDASTSDNTTANYDSTYFDNLSPPSMYTTTAPSQRSYTLSPTNHDYALTQYNAGEPQHYKVTMTLKQPCTQTMTNLMKMAVENGASLVVERDP